MKTKEYKGEKVRGFQIARLVPPSSEYPDCLCQLILTEQHLYVLEDNFDGTFETHFTFTIRQIKEIETVKSTKQIQQSGGSTPSLAGYSAVALMGLVGGLLILPGNDGWERKAVNFYLMIYYGNGTEQGERLYFNDLQSNPKGFKKAFRSVKKALSDY